MVLLSLLEASCVPLLEHLEQLKELLFLLLGLLCLLSGAKLLLWVWLAPQSLEQVMLLLIFA